MNMNDLNTTAAPDTSTSGMPSYTLWQLVLYMLRLGTLGFGGPVALVGYMYRDLVEQRGWISDADYKEGMALAQLMPGPLAAQLAAEPLQRAAHGPHKQTRTQKDPDHFGLGGNRHTCADQVNGPEQFVLAHALGRELVGA